jgi:CarboxypepD_reg-like domain/TonB-dependent Receptor Plug Domain
MKYLISQLFVLFISFHSFAQTLKGKVIDEATKQAIPNATISILFAEKQIQTDENGLFRLSNINIGRYSIKVTSVGFEEAIIKEVLLSTGKETDLTIQLTENYHQLNEVVIKTSKEYGIVPNEMATVSAKSISVEQTKRYAATWGDPARMALSFAGTSNVNDQTNEIVIRGNSPKGMLWKIDGVEVPNPSHFSNEGAAGGGLSALSTSVLGNSEFYTSAFPAEYGNATSGVFDVHLRKGNSDKRETTIQAGFQGLELGTEGPFSKKSKASYLINYRYSTLGFFKQVGLIPLSYDGVPKFQDLCFKVFLPFKKYTLSVWGLGGKSRFDYDNTKEYSVKEESNLYASGMNLFRYINKNAYWENILSFSGNDVIAGSVYNIPNNSYTDTRETTYSTVRFSSQFNQKINTKHQIRVGIIGSLLSYNLVSKIEIDNPTIGLISDTKLNDKGSSQYLQAFLQWKYRINPNFTLNTGLHSTYFTLNNKHSVEPRVGAKYQLGAKSNLTIGLGIHSRLEPISIYLSRVKLQNNEINENDVFTNKELSIPKAVHYVIGYETRPNKNWRINSELYLQKHSQIGVASHDFLFKNLSLLNELDVNLLNMPLLESTGKGQNYGIELTVERFLVDGFYLLGTTSLFKSTYTNLDGKSYTARFSNNFVQNILAGKEWKVGKEKKNIFSLNLRTTYAGGVRVVPIDLEKSRQEGYEVRDYSTIYNQQQLADFFRTDFKINYIKNAKRITSTFSLDLNNITNRQNPKRIYYDYTTKSIATYNQLGTLPVFNYRLEF